MAHREISLQRKARSLSETGTDQANLDFISKCPGTKGFRPLLGAPTGDVELQMTPSNLAEAAD